MKTLFFHAAAGHPKVAMALLRSTGSTLRPFNRFLDQAIRTARQRQFLYQLPWQPIRDLQQVFLTPVDRRVWVPRHPPAWRIADWPHDLEPDTTQPLMVVSPRSVTFKVRDYRRDSHGLIVLLDGDLRDDDQVWWCSRACTLTRDATASAPSTVEDLQGKSLRIRGTPQPDGDGWIFVMEAWNGESDLVVDGQLAEAHELPVTGNLRRVRDSAGRSFELTAGELRVPDLPADGVLTGDNGVRFAWNAARTGRRASGAVVQLLPPENEDAEDFLDPRAAFCEGDIQEVWTQERHHKSTSYKVRRVDSERYQLVLDRYPDKGTRLFLPVDIRNLLLQRRALRQLAEAPLPHHAGLLRLCEDPSHVRWPRFNDVWPDTWAELTDRTRNGTDEQRSFVAKALGSPDIALLEGPPGSGKTTAICELIQQLVGQGKRVLLCSSTHVAIDNVLERLIQANAPIDAVRIGRAERVDEKVQATQIDHKVAELVKTWRTVPHLRSLPDNELDGMAVRTVINAANLTCGTTMGIVRHPLFDDQDNRGNPRDRSITTMPHWDVLIVDEASKTLIQEFLVPALMARRWIVVGDVRQLPPFADRADIVANLRSVVDESGREVFPADHQRACLLLFRMTRPALRDCGTRWLVVEPPGVLDRIGEELLSRDNLPMSIARVVAREGKRSSPFHEVSIEQLRTGDPAALLLLACTWVLVADDLLAEVAKYLPADLLAHRELTNGDRGLPESHPLLFQHSWWLARTDRLRRPYTERRQNITTFAKAETHEQRWLAEHDLAAEIAWRLTRAHELLHNRNQRERDWVIRSLDELKPAAVDITEPIDEIQDIGLPSILEVLQEGIGSGRTSRPSALTEGMPRQRRMEFDARFTSLSYQHRMHADISSFPRELIYDGKSLMDANTITARDNQIDWTFTPFERRRAWVDVRGREQYGVNSDEIRVMEGILRAFLSWARQAGPSSAPRWEVACLSFYVKQERAISEMLRRVTGDDRHTRFTVGNVELTCGTVDRFQGREADLVLLSMRNTRRVGFLDSRNRLNVAVTRARQQLVIVGNAANFAGCAIAELVELVNSSPVQDARPWLKGKK